MTPLEARKAIISRYLTEFAILYPSVDIAIDNRKADHNGDWVRITVIFNTGSQDSLGKTGNRKYVRRGIINCQIFTPINTGTNVNDDMSNDSVNIFDGVGFAQDLWTYDGRIETIGSEDGEYYQQNAIIEFEFENIR